MSNCKITFELDGTGIYYDPAEPIHLDALLAWTLAPIHRRQKDLSRDDVPDDIPLPLARLDVGGDWIWRASALFPEGKTAEDMRYWRKKFRESRAGLTVGSPNLTNATYREWNQPMPILLCSRMVAYAVSKPARLRQLLKRVKYIGKKRSYGLGKVVNLRVEIVDYDWSVFRDDLAMRWIPDARGIRVVRPRPPYWNPHGAVPCLEIGENMKITKLDAAKVGHANNG